MDRASYRYDLLFHNIHYRRQDDVHVMHRGFQFYSVITTTTKQVYTVVKFSRNGVPPPLSGVPPPEVSVPPPKVVVPPPIITVPPPTFVVPSPGDAVPSP